MRGIYPGSLRSPRWGSGAIYGQSVSVRSLSMGVAAQAAGPFLFDLKVSAPPKAMYSPSPAQRSAISALPEKQCITPFILPP